MKIYTGKGDKGETSLLGGARVLKHHERIEAYGTVDELNSYVGVLRDLLADAEVEKILLEIQDRLFTMGSHLALEPAYVGKMKLPEISDLDIKLLEDEMDSMEARLPEMKNFILPGGHLTASHCHVARCICRRAERCVSGLSEHSDQDGMALKYLNRLSDYLFVLSRKLQFDSGAVETPWKPRYH